MSGDHSKDRCPTDTDYPYLPGRACPALVGARLWCFHTTARQRQDNDKTNVEPVHSYDAFHTRSNKPGVKGIIEMHRFNICLVVLSLSCSGVKTSFACS